MSRQTNILLSLKGASYDHSSPTHDDDLKLRNRSPRTIQSYIAHVAKFASYFGKSPEFLGIEEIRQYQVYLVSEGRVAWGTYNQAVCALRFFYRHTLERYPPNCWLSCGATGKCCIPQTGSSQIRNNKSTSSRVARNELVVERLGTQA